MNDQLLDRIAELERQIEILTTRDYVDHQGCIVTLSASETIGTGANATISWDAENFDNGDFWEGVTNPSRLTAPVDGVYHVSVQIRWAANSTGIRMLNIRKNGSDIVFQIRHDASVNFGTDQNLSGIVELDANDYLELIVYQNSGGDLNINNLTTINPAFGIIQLA